MSNKETEKRIAEIGELLYNQLEHNRITSKKQLDKAMVETIVRAAASPLFLAMVTTMCNKIYDYMHNRYSFGFCNICGDYINYDEGGWVDMWTLEPEELEAITPNIAKVLEAHKRPSDFIFQDVCSSCFNELKGEE